MIPAGRSGTLTAKVATRPLDNGRVSKSVAVTTDAPGQESLRVVLTFEAVAAVTVVPRPQLTLAAVTGDSAEGRVALHRPDGQPIEISATRVELPVELQLRSEPVSENVDVGGGKQALAGDLWLVALLPPLDQPASTRGRVLVKTNHPEAPEIELAVRVWVRPRIDVRPARIRLVLDDPLDPTPRVSVRLTHAKREPFSVSELELSHPDLLQATTLTEGRQAAVVVQIGLRDALGGKALEQPVEGSVRIRVSDPNAAAIEVPVTVVPPRTPGGRPVGPGPTPSPGASTGR